MSEIVVAGGSTILEAVAKIMSCEKCNAKADFEFGLIINFIKDANPRATRFCQTEPAHCPNCRAKIWEATLVSFFPPGEY